MKSRLRKKLKQQNEGKKVGKKKTGKDADKDTTSATEIPEEKQVEKEKGEKSREKSKEKGGDGPRKRDASQTTWYTILTIKVNRHHDFDSFPSSATGMLSIWFLGFSIAAHHFKHLILTTAL